MERPETYRQGAFTEPSKASLQRRAQSLDKKPLRGIQKFPMAHPGWHDAVHVRDVGLGLEQVHDATPPERGGVSRHNATALETSPTPIKIPIRLCVFRAFIECLTELIPLEGARREHW